VDTFTPTFEAESFLVNLVSPCSTTWRSSELISGDVGCPWIAGWLFVAMISKPRCGTGRDHRQEGMPVVTSIRPVSFWSRRSFHRENADPWLPATATLMDPDFKTTTQRRMFE